MPVMDSSWRIDIKQKMEKQPSSRHSVCHLMLCLIALNLLQTTMANAKTVFSYTAKGGAISTPQGEFLDQDGLPLSVSATTTEMTFDGEVSSIGSYAFHNCASLLTLQLPDCVTEVGYFTFSNCDELTEPIYNETLFARLPISYTGHYIIPETIETITSAAFRKCTGLTGVTIPSSISKIETSAFAGCTQLTSITIPASVHEIEDYAFCNCTNLQKVYFEAEIPAEISAKAFEGADNCVLFVPANSVTAYQQVCSLPAAPILDSETENSMVSFAGSFKNETLFGILNEAISNSKALVVDLKDVTEVPSGATVATPCENTLIKTSKNLGLSNDQNVVIAGTCDNLVITDNQPFTNDEAFQAYRAIYNRSMTNIWGTICLPFCLQSDEHVQYYTGGSISDNVLTLEKADEVPACQPAIFKRLDTESSSVSIEGNSVSVALTDVDKTSATDITLHGTFTYQELEEEGLYYIAQNKFWLKTEGQPLIMNAFRAWFTCSDSQKARSLTISEDESADLKAISSIMTGDATYYDLDGHQLTDLREGMNIVKTPDGTTQKVLIK